MKLKIKESEIARKKEEKYKINSKIQAQEVRVISFDEAVAIALEKNIQLRQEKNQLISMEMGSGYQKKH